jgi:hypothetical protein
MRTSSFSLAAGIAGQLLDDKPFQQTIVPPPPGSPNSSLELESSTSR